MTKKQTGHDLVAILSLFLALAARKWVCVRSLLRHLTIRRAHRATAL